MVADPSAYETKEEQVPPAETKTQEKKDETVYGEGDKEIVDARKDASYYCPGCGAPTEDEHKECTGTVESPHQPIAVVPTKELDGDPEKHTAAPNTEQ